MMLKRSSGSLALSTIGLVIVQLLVGCAGGGKAALDVVPLEVELVAEYPGSNVIVALEDDSTLQVTITEDVSASRAGDLGGEKAREVAAFVCDNYGSADRIDMLEVTLAVRRDGAGGDTTGRVGYAFPRDELACSGR